MKSSMSFLVAAAALTGPAFGFAASTTPAAAPQASVADEYTQGEIRKIENDGGKVTLKHGEIKNLGMPPMAMTFETKNPHVLDGFHVGDKVRFRADYESGRYVLRDIERVK